MKANNDIACLFDLDGVLVDSERIYTKIWEAIEKQWPTGIENFTYKIKGTTLEDILERYFPKDVREEVTRELIRLEGMMIYGPLPGAIEFLDALRTRGIPIALVTSSNGLKMDHLWHDMPGFKEKFDVVITGDEVERSKPDPEGYLAAATALGVDPKRCAVFEDSLQGVKAGKAAGAFVIGVAGTLKASDIQPYSDIVVNAVADIYPDRLEETLKARGKES
ncbi:MAG: HAD family phosphatase [Muribaculaceae bacterium]|nr:HAD family phosphatase [Muribaculaceae bacterium]